MILIAYYLQKISIAFGSMAASRDIRNAIAVRVFLSAGGSTVIFSKYDGRYAPCGDNVNYHAKHQRKRRGSGGAACSFQQ